MDVFMGGFEYSQYATFDDVFTGREPDNDPDDDFGTDDILVPLYSTYGGMKTSTLLSTYFSLGLTSKSSIFLRTDIYDSNIVSDATDDSETHLFLGFHFSASDHIDFAPVIKYNILEANDDPTIDFGINFKIFLIYFSSKI